MEDAKQIGTPAEPQQATPATAPAKERRQSPAFSLDLHEILHLFYSKWYWFVISLVITMTFGIIYVMRATPQYLAKSSIMLLNDDSSTQEQSVDLSMLGIRRKSGNVTNELYLLESLPIHEKVVTRLGLNNRYFTKKGLRLVELYKEEPIVVTPAEEIAAERYSFTVTLDGHKNFTLGDFSNAGSEVTATGVLGQTVGTPLGKFTITVSPWYDASDLKSSSIVYTHDTPANTAAGIVKVEAKQADDVSSVINLWVTDACLKRGVDIAQGLAEVYLDKRSEDVEATAKNTTEFINNRLALLEEDLGNVESSISAFKSSTGVPSVEASSSAFFGRSFSNQTEILNLNSELSMAQYIRRELSSDNIDQVLPVNTGLKADGIQSQIVQYNNMVMERNRVLSAGNENNPVITELTTTLRTLKANMVRSLDNYITVLNRQLSDIRTSDSRASGELAANPEREKYLLSVERQQKVKESLYMFLLQKREESELSQAYVKPTAMILSEGQGFPEPFYPRTFNILLICFVVGIMAPVVIIFLRESLNTTIRGRRDLGMLSLPFVGEIPYGPGSRRPLSFTRHQRSASAGSDIVVKEGSNNVINEAFRAIRTSLEFMTPTRPDGTGHVIAFTSANQGSGKTFIVMNLATALSLSGKRVLVVDFDMRKATISKWGGRCDRGVSNYLIGKAGLDQIIVHGLGENHDIDLLPVGIIPPNPVELLSSTRVAELFEALRKDYDYVLVDCTPAEIVADARLVSAVADMTVWIIRAGMFERSMLNDIEEFAEEGRYHNLCIILNGTDPNNLYRRKRYGYGYGYTSKR